MGLAQDILKAGIFNEIEVTESEAYEGHPAGLVYCASWGNDLDSYSYESYQPHKYPRGFKGQKDKKYKNLDEFAAEALKEYKEWLKIGLEHSTKLVAYNRKLKKSLDRWNSSRGVSLVSEIT
jgi:hypothetical protein